MYLVPSSSIHFVRVHPHVACLQSELPRSSFCLHLRHLKAVDLGRLARTIESGGGLGLIRHAPRRCFPHQDAETSTDAVEVGAGPHSHRPVVCQELVHAVGDAAKEREEALVVGETMAPSALRNASRHRPGAAGGERAGTRCFSSAPREKVRT